MTANFGFSISQKSAEQHKKWLQELPDSFTRSEAAKVWNVDPGTAGSRIFRMMRLQIIDQVTETIYTGKGTTIPSVYRKKS